MTQAERVEALQQYAEFHTIISNAIDSAPPSYIEFLQAFELQILEDWQSLAQGDL